jgi:hypothetical protein
MGFAGRVHAQPGWDPWGVHEQSSELLDKGDFQGLETLVSQLKKNGYSIQQEEPELGGFYGGTKVADDAPPEAWPDRLNVIEKWRAAFPDSLAAKIAEVYWYIDYPSDIYVPPPAPGTLPTPDDVPKQVRCMDKAVSLLKEIPAAKVDDPEYYVCWLKICDDLDRPEGEMWGYFKRGVALAPDYERLYYEAVEARSAMSLKKPGVQEKEIRQWANRWPGPKGAALYAYLIADLAEGYDLTFMKNEPNVDYNFAKWGLQKRLSENDPARYNDESTLAFLAVTKGDNATAKRMFLEIEDSADLDLFRGKGQYMTWRRTTGAKAEIDNAFALERAGKLADAEAKFLSFTSDPGLYLPLEFFYEREGMLDKLLAMKVTVNGKTVKEMMAIDPGYAPADVLGEMASDYAMMGEWDKARIAAQRFDQLRPYNMIGKNVLLLCAIHDGDAVKTMDAVMNIVRMHARYKPYHKAQAVLDGSRTWERESSEMKNDDIYLGQGTTAIVLYYMARGENDEAKKIMEEQLPWCAENSGKAMLESLLYGSLSRTLKPVALLPAGMPPAATSGTAGATATGTSP